jgi:4,5-dihydroxyphthalate decarboxylase
VGVPEYQMTAAVWVRGALSDDYGVPSSAIEWVQGGLEDAGRIPFEPVEPRGVTLSVAPEDKSLARMLADGDIHALVTARTPSTFHPAHGPIRRLFDEPWKVEGEYFEHTGIFPSTP